VKARAFVEFLEAEMKNLRQGGLVRPELELETPQGPVVKLGDREVVSFASNDHLGYATHRAVKAAATAAIETWGVGVASPRTAVGTLALHGRLERAVADLVGAPDALVYASGHHADTGLFESLVGDRDFVFSDEMIRPSLADGIRLSRARVYAYRNGDMAHLEDRLKRSRAARFRLIVTDGFFPVTGRIADLPAIRELANKYDATVVVDDTHGIGLLGDDGGGVCSHFGVRGKIDLVTGSFGAALGGGAGGFIAGHTSIIMWLRQKSRPHIASTALAPAAAAAALEAIRLVKEERQLRADLRDRVRAFDAAMAKEAGFSVGTTHPAFSVRVKNAIAAQRITDALFRKGMFVTGYCHPVVPEGDARLSVRVSVLHEDQALSALAQSIGEGMRELKVPL
jgi:glycine C-acetyltransferase